MSTDTKYPLSLSKLPDIYRNDCVKIKEELFKVLKNGLLNLDHFNTDMDIAVGSTALAQLILEFIKLLPREQSKNIVDLIYWQNIQTIIDGVSEGDV